MMKRISLCLLVCGMLLGMMPAGQASRRPPEATLAVFDRSNTVGDRLKAIGRPFIPVTFLTALPEGTKTVLVGPETLTEGEATAPLWKRLLKQGVSFLVLEQSYPHRPLHDTSAPEHTWLCEFPANYSMQESAGSPLLHGLTVAQLNAWPGTGSETYPLYGALTKAMLDGAVDPNAKDRLYAALLPENVSAIGRSAVSREYTPILVWKGPRATAILCQMPVGGRMARDPVAQKLFDNMIGYLTALPRTVGTTGRPPEQGGAMAAVTRQ